MAARARNLCYAQSGGVTAVINATAAGVIEEAARQKKIGKVFAAKNGVIGVLREELCETWRESKSALAALSFTPGGAFGSCRLKMPPPRADDGQMRRLLEVFAAHDIGYFVYNGGNDSADTAQKIAAAAARRGYALTVVGAPKTIDNDLAATDCCPGFGSAAKYVAVSAREAELDLASMARSSTKVLIIEVMGRNAGWLAAAGGLAARRADGGALMIVFPEIPFSRARFAAAARRRVDAFGHCVVVASEGARDETGAFLAAAETRDSFSHAQLGGAAAILANIARADLGLKTRFAICDYLQRAARHIASKTDLEQARAVGRAAARFAVAGRSGFAPVIVRVSDSPYKWKIAAAPLAKLANRERKLPRAYISRDGFFITAAARRYLSPLIAGEDFPPFAGGLPRYAELKNILVRPKLAPWRE